MQEKGTGVMRTKVLQGRNLTKYRELPNKLANSPVARRVLQYAVYFAAGFVCSRGVVFGRHAPFGVAAAAAGPYRGMWLTIAGGIVGYLWPSHIHAPVRYIAALMVVAAIRWALNEVFKIRGNVLFAPLATFVPLMGMGAAMAGIEGATAQTWILYTAESLLGGCGAFFISRTSSMILAKRGAGTLNHIELACGILTAGILVLSLSSILIGDISLGRVAAVLMVLFACRYGGVVGGSIAGIVAGAMFGLSTSGISGVSGALAFAGLMAGLFSPLGRVATALVFIAAHGLGTLQVGSYEVLLTGLYEVMGATVIFVVWPNRTGGFFATLFRQPADISHSDGLRRSVIMKLGFAAAALEQVSESVEAVSQRLAKVSAPTIQGVYQRAIDETCSTCGLQTYCWGHNHSRSMAWMQTLEEPLRVHGQIAKSDFPEEFQKHCGRLLELASYVNRHYEAYLTQEAAERRVAQVRGVVTDQFSTTGRMLRDIAGELELFEQFDYESAHKINEALHETSIRASDVSCRLDRYNRMVVEVEAPVLDRSRLGKPNVLRAIARATGRRFENPCISVVKKKCRLQMSERPIYKVSVGTAQHSCANRALCGDSYECFADGTGRYIAMISDGMGTGGRAAVDGAMASGIMSTLIKAGVGFDCALKIANSALMVKSGEETLSTLDVAAINLFDGAVEFMKAGAPVSFLRRKGEVQRLDAVSLPVGILEEAIFSRVSTKAEDGDFIVMFSDGVIASGEGWVAQTLEDWTDGDPTELAELLVEKAVKNRSDGHDDDITAVVLKLTIPKLEAV